MPCNKCGSDGPFPSWTDTICKACDAERKAAWYQRKHPDRVISHRESHQEEVQLSRPGDLEEIQCQDCEEAFFAVKPASGHSRLFCDECIALHESETLENRKEAKAEYDRNRMKEKRRDGYQKSEKEKEHNKEYMREYRERKRKEGND